MSNQVTGNPEARAGRAETRRDELRTKYKQIYGRSIKMYWCRQLHRMGVVFESVGEAHRMYGEICYGVGSLEAWCGADCEATPNCFEVPPI